MINWRMGLTRDVTHVKDVRNAHKCLLIEPEGKRQLGKCRHKCKGIININIQEEGGGMVWTGLIWLRIGTTHGTLWTW
jgi:hypothetical protein